MMKTIILILTIIICLPVSLYATDYESMTRVELLQELLATKQQLLETTRLYQSTLLEFQSEMIARQRITRIACMYQDNIRLLQSENQRLNRLLENPFNPGDVFFDIRLGAGVSLSGGASSRIYITHGLYGFLEAGIFSAYLWDWSADVRFMGLAGLGWSF